MTSMCTDSSYPDMVQQIKVSALGVVPRPICAVEIEQANITVRVNLAHYAESLGFIRDDVRRVIHDRIPKLEFMLDIDCGNYLFPGQIVNLVMHSKMNVGHADSEVWFNINSMPIRFGLQEYCLVSGLSLGKIEGEREQVGKTEWAYRLFPNHRRGNNMKIPEIEEVLIKWKKEAVLGEERLLDYTRLLMVCLMGRMVYTKTHKEEIPMAVFGLFENLEWANEFGWGRYFWHNFLEMVKEKAWEANLDRSGRRKYQMTFFPHIFLGWICEAIPKFGDLLGRKRDEENIRPRLAKWMWRSCPTVFSQAVQIWKSVDRVYPTLIPTNEEKHESYWHSYIAYEKEVPSVLIYPQWTVLFKTLTVVINDLYGKHTFEPTFNLRKKPRPQQVTEGKQKRKRGWGRGKSSDLEGDQQKKRCVRKTKTIAVPDSPLEIDSDSERTVPVPTDPATATASVSSVSVAPPEHAPAQAETAATTLEHKEGSGPVTQLEQVEGSHQAPQETINSTEKLFHGYSSEEGEEVQKVQRDEQIMQVKRKPEGSKQMSKHPSTDDNDDVGCESVQAACLQQIVAACNVLRMVEKKKGDNGGNANADAYKLLRKSNIEQISSVANVLIAIEKEKGNEMDKVLALNRVLITKERKSNNELVEAHKALVEGLPELLIPDTGITTKRMGEIDILPFADACKKKYPASGEANEKASELCSLWQGRLSDPSFYPFSVQTIQGTSKEVLDEEDCELKRLREDWGLQVYEAVTAALKEMNECNPSGRYPVSVLWNSRESRKATLKELVEYMMKAMKTQACNRLHEAGPFRNRKY